ncbi:hypothetical protein BDQ17DRAFT_1330989 [Cyathus striatus]|nr:hypothetical protein BDQ17DRAFT_1330989 [Cyathus striatus]
MDILEDMSDRYTSLTTQFAAGRLAQLVVDQDAEIREKSELARIKLIQSALTYLHERSVLVQTSLDNSATEWKSLTSLLPIVLFVYGADHGLWSSSVTSYPGFLKGYKVVGSSFLVRCYADTPNEGSENGSQQDSESEVNGRVYILNDPEIFMRFHELSTFNGLATLTPTNDIFTIHQVKELRNLNDTVTIIAKKNGYIYSMLDGPWTPLQAVVEGMSDNGFTSDKDEKDA